MAFQTITPKNTLIKRSDLKAVSKSKKATIPSPITFYPDNKVACLSADSDLDPFCHNISSRWEFHIRLEFLRPLSFMKR